MPLDVTYGETSAFKFLVLTGPTLVRPADFDTTALSLPELTTSDMPVTVSTTTDPAPKMYGSPAAGSGLTWAKPKPDQGSWSASLNGNVQPSDAERLAMETLNAAHGKYVWVERRMNTDTTNEGGCAIVTGSGKPIPSDAIVTFSFGLTGYGPLYPDTSAIA